MGVARGSGRVVAQWGAAGLTGVLVSLASPAAQACAIAMPSCTSASNDRISSSYINPPNRETISLFDELNAAGDVAETLYLVECTSRQGVKVPLAQGSAELYPAYEYLTDLVVSDEVVTLQQVRAGLRALGFRAALTRLPAGHCGCDLPAMPTIGCGDFGP